METKKEQIRNLLSSSDKNIIGILLLVLLFFVIFFPKTTFAATNWGVSINSSGFSAVIGSGSGYGSSGGGWSLNNSYGLPEGSISGIISNLLSWLLKMFSFFGVIGFVISGILYLVSGGNDEMITKAKNGMTWSIIGIIVGLSGLVIMQAVFALLGGASSNF
ncbi:MAG: pilin [Candidatus Moraniibacteriota bacterium]